MDVVLSGNDICNGDAATLPYPKHPINGYIATKIAAEKLIRAADGSRLPGGGAMRTVALRPGHIYGERDPHALKTVAATVRSGGLPFLLGNPKRAKIDVTYSSNVAHAHVLAAAALANEDFRCAGGAYHISEGNHQNWWDFCRPYVECKGLVLTSWYLPYWVVYTLAVIIELLHWVVSSFTEKFGT